MASSLVELLRLRAGEAPDRRAYTFLLNGEAPQAGAERGRPGGRGPGPGEKPNWTVEEMARDYLAEVRRAQPSGPYRLGGWCMGGVVAFAMARQLEAAGEAVERLVLIDSQVPWLRDTGEGMPRDEILLVQLFARDLAYDADSLPPPDPAARESGELACLRQLLDVARVAGDHYTMVREPQVETLAREVERALGR